MKKIFLLLFSTAAMLTASAQLNSLYMIVANGDANKSYSLADISKVHFGQTTLDVVTAEATDSYDYVGTTAVISESDEHTHNYVNGFCDAGDCTAPYEAATLGSDGSYELASGGNLFWFAEQVNGGTGAAYSAKLTADIDLENRLWTPIGVSTAFTGGFDGQGYTISNLNIVADASVLYAAFIGNHTGTNDIKDFRINGAVTVNGTANSNYAAGVVANASGAHKIQDVWCSVNITNGVTTTSAARYAGIVTHALSCTINRCVYDGTIAGNASNLQVAGILGWPDDAKVSITNCLFSGKLSSTGTGSGSAYMGGLVGYTSRAINCANNLSIGALESPAAATRTGAIVGQSTYATPSVFANNYIKEGQPVAGTATAATRVPTATEANDAQIADGSLVAGLGSVNWVQLGETPVPSTFGPTEHTHNYINGFCNAADCTAPYQEATVNADGSYEIANGGQLFWLAQEVNNGSTAYNAKLTADVDLENRLWTPIGLSTAYAGEFDGDGHSISNLNIVADAAMDYAAFIGKHSGTKDVKNFRLYGTVAASGTTENHYVAGVVAYSSGANKIQDVWCSVNITNTNTAAVKVRMAGIVTKAEATTINRCVFDGTITGNATSLQVAGIIGWPNANNTSVSNCLFSGKLQSTGTAGNSAYLGGIVGYAPSTRSGLSFANNLCIGEIDSPSGATRSGALAGNSTTAVTSYSNNYVLSGLAAVGTATTKIPEVSTVTKAQLADGSLVDALGSSNWVQGEGKPYPQESEGGGDDEDDYVVDGIKYNTTSATTVEVTYPNAEQPSSANKCTYTGEITIPETVTIKGKTYTVTAIGDYAFHYASITSLTLPETIVRLGYKSIYQTQLTEIVVPNSVTTMDYEALGYNKQLEKITFGENIAANTWGDKLCIYGGKKYDVYMYCKSVPTLRSYTFFNTGATVHVYPMMYSAFRANAAWAAYDIVGDLWIEYSYQDLQETIAAYKALLPQGDAVGSDPGCYTVSSTAAFASAIAEAEILDEGASLQQLNEAINNILIAYDALYVNPLNEGVYYITNTFKPTTALYLDAATATTQGLKVADYKADDARFYFKVTLNGGGWNIQSLDNGTYVGTTIGGNSSGRNISANAQPTNAQIVTWVNGGNYKIQSQYSGSTTTLPYRSYGNAVTAYNYAAGTTDEPRNWWHFHPVSSDKYQIDYNLENSRVRGFVHDVVYTGSSDASKVNAYNIAPPVRRDQPAPATIFWNRDETSTAQQLTWSQSPDFAEATVVDVDNAAASYEIYNLIPGNAYYYKVTATLDGGDTKELINSSFRTTGQVRQIKANSVANIRDLGGWPTASGYPVKYGLIFRGAEFNNNHNIEPEDIEILRNVGIRAELDLRSNGEAANITASVLGSDVNYKRTALGQTASHMTGLTNSTATYKAAVQFVLDNVRDDKPVYFHCAIGRDRTGTVAFLLEGVLGLSKGDIYKDYELTNFSYYATPCSKGQLDDMFAMVEALDGQTLEDKFHTYLTTTLGIAADDIAAFRTKMLGLPTPLTPAEVRELITAAFADGQTTIDLSDSEFADDVTAADLAADGNVLVIAPTESGIAGRNIILDGICQELVLTDGHPFQPTVSFTAANATYTSSLADGGWHSLVLPYGIAVPEGVEVVNNARVDGTVVTLDLVEDSVPANTPFLYRLPNGGELSLSAADVLITATAPQPSGQLTGTYTGLAAGQATGKLLLAADGQTFAPATASQAVAPLSSYIDGQFASGTYTILIDDDPLSVRSATGNGEERKENRDAYDLQGRKRSTFNVQPSTKKGIYIVGGQKILY